MVVENKNYGAFHSAEVDILPITSDSRGSRSTNHPKYGFDDGDPIL